MRARRVRHDRRGAPRRRDALTASRQTGADAGATRPTEPIERHVWLLAVVVVLGAAGSIVATSSVNVAFPALSRELDAGIDTVQWVATGYLLGLAGVIATTGWLARRVGARGLYLVSLLLFALASVLCSLATSIELLIAARVLQGLAGGATLPVGQMMLAAAAGPQRMGGVMSVIGVPMILAPAFGPVIGGVLVQHLGWQSIFLMNVPLALAALALGVRLLPHMPARPAGPFDTPGFALVVLGAPALVYGMARAGQSGSLTDPVAVATATAGALALAAFAVHAWRSAHPLLDVRLWANPGFAACATTAILVAAGIFGMYMLLPLFFQLVRGQDPTATGLMLMFQGLGAALATGVSGRLVDRIGGGPVALGGIALMLPGTAVFAFVAPGTPTWALGAALFVRGLGLGASIMPAMAAAYATLRPRDLPEAAPQLNIIQRIGGSIGTAVLAVILANQLEAAAPGRAAETAAFAHAFAWAVAVTALALVPAAVLLAVERRRSTAG